MLPSQQSAQTLSGAELSSYQQGALRAVTNLHMEVDDTLASLEALADVPGKSFDNTAGIPAIADGHSDATQGSRHRQSRAGQSSLQGQLADICDVTLRVEQRAAQRKAAVARAAHISKVRPTRFDAIQHELICYIEDSVD